MTSPILCFRQAILFKETEFPYDADFCRAKFCGNTYFVLAKFGGEANFMLANFSGKAHFGKTEFCGEACFANAKFSGIGSFWSAKFGGKACFSDDAKFRGNANFRYAEFGGDANFKYARFIKEVDFGRIKLSKDAIIIFDGENKDKPVFQGDADFRHIEIGKDAKIKFRKINLSKCDFLETDLTRVEFIDVKWAKTRWFWNKFEGRNAVYDEIRNGNDDDCDYRLIAQLYRRLQINYIDNCHYCEAGDFHIGEQEMVRKGRGKFWRYFSTSMMYKVASNYGESFRRPFLWLAFFLLLFPAFFLYSGIDLASPAQQEAGFTNSVNYEWTVDPSDFLLFSSDYWDAFTANLSFISFSRGQVSKRLHSQGQVLIVYAESILVIILISFFVLALRRPYKRKI